MLGGYEVYIRFYNGCVVEKHFRCNSKYDLFCYIGWLYSTSLTEIERVDYKYITAFTWDLSIDDLKLRYESEV